MPDDITISIDSLEINDSVKVSDLHRDNLTMLDPKNTVVVGVRVTRIVEEPKTEAELAKEAEASTAAEAAATEAKPAEETKGKK